MPCRPSAPICGHSSRGKRLVSSISAARGAITSRCEARGGLADRVRRLAEPEVERVVESRTSCVEPSGTPGRGGSPAARLRTRWATPIYSHRRPAAPLPRPYPTDDVNLAPGASACGGDGPRSRAPAGAPHAGARSFLSSPSCWWAWASPSRRPPTPCSARPRAPFTVGVADLICGGDRDPDAGGRRPAGAATPVAGTARGAIPWYAWIGGAYGAGAGARLRLGHAEARRGHHAGGHRRLPGRPGRCALDQSGLLGLLAASGELVAGLAASGSSPLGAILVAVG